MNHLQGSSLNSWCSHESVFNSSDHKSRTRSWNDRGQRQHAISLVGAFCYVVGPRYALPPRGHLLPHFFLLTKYLMFSDREIKSWIKNIGWSGMEFKALKLAPLFLNQVHFWLCLQQKKFSNNRRTFSGFKSICSRLYAALTSMTLYSNIAHSTLSDSIPIFDWEFWRWIKSMAFRIFKTIFYLNWVQFARSENEFFWVCRIL